MKNIIPHYIIVFGIGAFGYGGIEILYRGHTHPTMLFAGGIALLSLFEISIVFKIKSYVSVDKLFILA